MTIAPSIFGTPMILGMPQEVQVSLAASVALPVAPGHSADYAKMVKHIDPAGRGDPVGAEVTLGYRPPVS